MTISPLLKEKPMAHVAHHKPAIIAFAAGIWVMPLGVFVLFRVPSLQSAFLAKVAGAALIPVNLAGVLLVLTAVFYRRKPRLMVIEWCFLAPLLAAAFVLGRELSHFAYYLLVATQEETLLLSHLFWFVPSVVLCTTLIAATSSHLNGALSLDWASDDPPTAASAIHYVLLWAAAFFLVQCLCVALPSVAARLLQDNANLDSMFLCDRLKQSLYHGINVISLGMVAAVAVSGSRKPGQKQRYLILTSSAAVFIAIAVCVLRIGLWSGWVGYGSVLWRACVTALACIGASVYCCIFLKQKMRPATRQSPGETHR